MEAFGLAFGGGRHESGEELFQHAENGPGGEAGGKKKGGKKKKKKPKGGGGGGGAPVMTIDMLGGGYGGGPEEEKFAGGNFTKSPAPEELPMPSEGLLQFLSAESLDSAASSTPGAPLAATAQGNGGNNVRRVEGDFDAAELVGLGWRVWEGRAGEPAGEEPGPREPREPGPDRPPPPAVCHPPISIFQVT